MCQCRCRKPCSTKNVKSVSGSAMKGSQHSHNALSSSSLALLQKAQSAVKLKGAADKKSKKAKRSLSADTTKTVHPPFSHRVGSVCFHVRNSGQYIISVVLFYVMCSVGKQPQVYIMVSKYSTFSYSSIYIYFSHSKA